MVLWALVNSDVAELVSKLSYHEGYGIVVPLEWEFDEDWNGEDMNDNVSSIKKKITDKDFTDTSGSSHSYSNNVNAMLQSESQKSINQKSKPLLCVPVSPSFQPSAISTPNTTTRNSDASPIFKRSVAAVGFVHFSPVEDADLSGYGFQKVNLENVSREEFDSIHSDARKFLDIISTAHEAGIRKQIGDWLKMADNDALDKPTPVCYHRDYTTEYLSKSFDGEPFPGVYLPCSSGWSESRAVRIFTNEKGFPPPTIKDLNCFVEEKYPIVLPDWDPSVHISGLPSYSLDIYPKLNLPLRPPTAMNLQCDIVKYTPYCWETARQRVNVYGNLLRPLFPFIADPLLTTVSFNFGISERFLGRTIPHPNGSGRLVCRTRPFNTSALTNNARVNKSTLIGRCAYCTGLFVLPCHNIVLCYFVPDGLKILTQDIIAAWKCGRISVCAVHFLHRGRKFNNGLLNNIVPGI